MRSQYLTYEKKHTDERKQYVVVVVAAAATASPGMVGGRAGATDGVDGYPTPPAKKCSSQSFNWACGPRLQYCIVRGY